METECRNIGMTFGKTKALQDINLTIHDGDFLAILGPSGCGKTTLLRLLAGFSAPTQGEIRIGAELVAGNGYVKSPNERNISMVFQSYALWPHMTVEQNIAFPIRNSRFVTSKQRSNCSERVQQLVEMVGLHAMEKRLPAQLSGGQRQRVALARALAAEPALLLMDEPLSNLDSELRIEMRQELKRLHRATGTTIVYVTHDQSEALALANRIVVMNHGRIEQVGTAKEIYEAPQTEFVARFVGRSNLLHGHWTENRFLPEGAETVWQLKDVPDTFRKSGLLALKPEQLRISEKNNGIPATIKEIEYLGAEMRVLLSSGQTALEMRTKEMHYQVGDALWLTV